jgi:hypothetical protein
MASIRQRLKLAPFALDTEAAAATAALPAASDLIVGVAGPRYSDTIDEYEWLTVRIDRVAPPTTGVRLGDYALSASIVITLSLLINRHNTLPLEDWHPAESTLFTSRLSDIRTALGMTLDKLCKASQWSNARQVLCEPKN